MELALYHAFGAKLAAEEFAPGIPKARKIEPLPRIEKPQKWMLAIQRHFADRAGEHLDLRLVDTKTGKAHSWALPQATIPKPGEQAVWAIPQPTHTADYALTAGKGKTYRIEAGYGKGTVKMERLEPIEVHHMDDSSDGTRVRFNIYTSKGPEEFAIVKTKAGKEILVNKTPHRKRLEHLPLGGKPDLKSSEPSRINFENNDEVMMPKYDGAHALLDLEKPGQMGRVYSYRIPKHHGAGVIEHTHKVPLMLKTLVPEDLKGTTLRAELIGVDRQGKAIPAKDIGGLLNSGVEASREKQKLLGVTLRPVAFDVVRFQGKNIQSKPFSERFRMLQAIKKRLGIPITEVAFTSEQKKKLLASVEAGQHKLTTEGVVLRPMNSAGASTKIKFRPDHDVYVREIFGATGKDGKALDRAGGFRYSHTPQGKIVGAVGTGFDHAMLKDMLKNPESYVGRVAKVEAETKFESGALSKPAFMEWHLDKGKQKKS